MAEGYKEFLAGSAGGLTVKLFDYPFDTVKVLLQTQHSLRSRTDSVPNHVNTQLQRTTLSLHSTIGNYFELKPPPSMTVSQSPFVYRGAIHCLLHIIQTRGFFSLYIGITSPLIGSMAENATLFLSYGQIKRLMGETPCKELSLFQLALSGAMAGGITSFVLNPFEVIKIQMQVMNSDAVKGLPRNYNGFIDCLVQTVKHDGIVNGLYRGHTALLLREIPGNFCWYGVYESVCLSQIPQGGTKRDLGPSTHLLGGAAAGVAYWTAFYPADTVGSQMRANPKYASRAFSEIFLEIYRSEGVRGLYRGWSMTAIRAAPAHALIFAIYEQTMALFRRTDSRALDCSDSVHR